MELFLKASELEDHDTLQIKKLKRYIQIEESDILSVDDLLDIIEELYYECERLDEELEYLKQDVEDNYRPVSKAEQYEG
jgi:hypothetical protein